MTTDPSIFEFYKEYYEEEYGITLTGPLYTEEQRQGCDDLICPTCDQNTRSE